VHYLTRIAPKLSLAFIGLKWRLLKKLNGVLRRPPMKAAVKWAGVVGRSGSLAGSLRRRRPMTKASPGLLVLDPGFGEAFGHHPAINRLIADYAHQRGLPVRLLASKRCPDSALQDFCALKAFEHSVYTFMPEDWRRTLALLDTCNKGTRAELVHFLGHASTGDTIVVHTASQWNIRGMYEWARTLEQSNLRFKFLFRFEPSFSPVPYNLTPENQTVLSAFYRETIRSWKSLPHEVEFFVDSVVLEEEFKRICPIDYRMLSVQVEFPEDVRLEEPPPRYDRPPIFLFVGNAREEKGIGLLPEAVQYYLAQGHRGRFIVQSLDLAPPHIAERVRAVDSIEVLDRPLAGQKYFDFVRSGDVVLAAYNPDRYRFRTSHIFVEALGLGRPAITSKGSWMDAELAYLTPGSALVLEDYSGRALGKAMVEFDRRRRKVTEQARAGAARVRDRHNRNAFIRAFLG
jgi:glycosyltransferase involved in cell wall biosynthesis